LTESADFLKLIESGKDFPASENGFLKPENVLLTQIHLISRRQKIKSAWMKAVGVQ
jgi:hypothetical protein